MGTKYIKKKPPTTHQHHRPNDTQRILNKIPSCVNKERTGETSMFSLHWSFAEWRLVVTGVLLSPPSLPCKPPACMSACMLRPPPSWWNGRELMGYVLGDRLAWASVFVVWMLLGMFRVSGVLWDVWNILVSLMLYNTLIIQIIMLYNVLI